jgi:hypothetical protein
MGRDGATTSRQGIVASARDQTYRTVAAHTDVGRRRRVRADVAPTNHGETVKEPISISEKLEDAKIRPRRLVLKT